MVPPVLVDVNKDGVRDIVMSAFDGTMILYCGETMAIKWKVKFENRESYRYVHWSFPKRLKESEKKLLSYLNLYLHSPKSGHWNKV